MSSGKLEFVLLCDVDDAAQQAVIGACTPRRFARREVVFHEGDPGDCLHLVVSGRFAVRVTTPRGDGVTLRVIGTGGVFGELVLLDPHARRVATVVALEPARTLVLTAARFAALRRRHPQVDRVLVAMLADNVRRLSGQVLEALYVPVDEAGRPAAARAGRRVRGRGPGDPGRPRRDGRYHAGQREPRSARLADRGVVALGRGRIVVRHLPALGRAASRRDGQASPDRAHRLMPASTACWSMRLSSASSKAGSRRAARLSSSWATLLAPISTDVTRASRSAQASAICASDWPRPLRRSR